MNKANMQIYQTGTCDENTDVVSEQEPGVGWKREGLDGEGGGPAGG